MTVASETIITTHTDSQSASFIQAQQLAKVTLPSGLAPLSLNNAKAATLASIPLFPAADAFAWLMQATRCGCRLIALFPFKKYGDKATLFIAVADDTAGAIYSISTSVEHSYLSLTGDLPQAHLFERVLYEEHGITPEGHPWLKPVRFSQTNGPDSGTADFYTISGEEVHEVAVGPIHAGVIECGHFRFQCLGEIVMHLEISLGYHHRSIRPLILGRPSERTMALMETVAGDATIAHAWAYCSLIEGLRGETSSDKGQTIRALALELERLANHTGDLGALAGDTGFLPTQSFCGRLRGDWLNITASLCGSRFGRGLVRPGGTAFDVDKGLAKSIAERIASTGKDVHGAANLLWRSSSFLSRIADTGAISITDAEAIGMVGPAARACGLPRDVRKTHPLPGTLQWNDIQMSKLGDVLARTELRQKEVHSSITHCQNLLQKLHDIDNSPAKTVCEGPLPADSFAVSLVEGWRGEVCHVAMTDSQGAIASYEIIDPSFHNWLGLALAMRNQQIADFPLCNKSFNLSYCGHDL